MTREEAIHKMEYGKRAYQMLIDEKVQEGVLVGHGINAEWSADTSIIDVYKDMLEACDMAIKALEQKPKWIPVSERLPEDGQSVLFCDIDDDIMVGYHVKGRPDTHFSQDGTYEDMKNVRAWMPLPKPYEPQESEDKE